MAIVLIGQKTLADCLTDGFHQRQPHKFAWRHTYGDKCLFCGRKMAFSARAKEGNIYATFDHINARGLGGLHEPSNIQVICRRCNQEKAKAESELVSEDS